MALAVFQNDRPTTMVTNDTGMQAPLQARRTLVAILRVKTILVIDDDAELCEMITFVLEAQGHRVLVSCNGRHGCDLASEVLPDAVLCDLLMPEMTGFEVINRLREDARTARIPVAVMTGERHLRNHAAAPRCAMWLDKPFDITELIEAVAHLLHPRDASIAA
jgi:CheY-like chemotaxis protein